jgi:hypothetical protein
MIKEDIAEKSVREEKVDGEKGIAVPKNKKEMASPSLHRNFAIERVNIFTSQQGAIKE